MTRPPDAATAELLARWTDSPAPAVLGEGMEGVVYEIDRTRVAKAWRSGSVAARLRLQAFYEALAASPVELVTPRILEVAETAGRVVTLEQRLPGGNLAGLAAAGRVSADEARSVVLDVLTRLTRSGPLPEARSLPVLDESQPLHASADDFVAVLTGLIERRLDRFGGAMAASVADLDELAAALPARLREVDTGRRCVVHGDLFPANILVADAQPPAVVDWGFLSTEGDPAFDAAIAASIFDMYGAGVLRNELELYGAIEAHFGYEHRALLVYRAAYSIITANAYDPTGADGHFAWCVRALNRADVCEAVLGEV